MVARNAKGHKVAPYGLLQRKVSHSNHPTTRAFASHCIRHRNLRCRSTITAPFSITFRSYSPQDFPHELEIELPLEPLTALTNRGKLRSHTRCHIRCRCTIEELHFASTAYSAFARMSHQGDPKLFRIARESLTHMLAGILSPGIRSRL